MVLAGGDFGALGGDFLPRVTWVHPSSSLLLGSFPASAGVFILLSSFAVADVDGAGALFVDADINGVLDAIVAFTVVGAVDVVVVAAVFTAAPVAFVGMTSQSGLFVYNASIAVFGLPQPPTWLAPHTQLCGGLPGTLPC